MSKVERYFKFSGRVFNLAKPADERSVILTPNFFFFFFAITQITNSYFLGGRGKEVSLRELQEFYHP